jgi:hypothetical protein
MMELVKTEEMLVGATEVSKGDIVRIDGEKGQKFIFMNHVINKFNDAQWVDVVHIQKGSAGPLRSFRPDRVKLIPKRGKKRGKN